MAEPTETKLKPRPTGDRMGIRRRLRAELSFSWESLRLNGRGLVFALLTGLVVGLCGGAFVWLLGLAERKLGWIKEGDLKLN